MERGRREVEGGREGERERERERKFERPVGRPRRGRLSAGLSSLNSQQGALIERALPKRELAVNVKVDGHFDLNCNITYICMNICEQP